MNGSEAQESAVHVARNQSLFRAVNEQIEATNERFSVILENRIDFAFASARTTTA